MNEMRLELRHLPPTVRERAERELGIARPKREHRVFVYGTLLKGECNARQAPRARRARARATGTLYDTGYGFPAFVKSGSTRIVGELLTVDDEAFAMMDHLERCPSLYRREKISVALCRGGRTLAWVYIMNHLPEGATVIESGDWRKHRIAKANADAKGR